MSYKKYYIPRYELVDILKLFATIDDNNEVHGKDTNLGDLETNLMEIKVRIMSIIDNDRRETKWEKKDKQRKNRQNGKKDSLEVK